MFDANEFLQRLMSGQLDGRLHEEIRKLSYEQLEQVALRMAEHIKARDRGPRGSLASRESDH
jgi:hypothetical protein